MAIVPYLAMTAAEMRNCPSLPPKVAWMACHFSPYGTGLSNLPRTLPEGSLLMVDDITPMHGHDPERIASQLIRCIQTLECSAVLLDFQRPGNSEAAELAQYLSEVLPCPLGISSLYPENKSASVFLPPVLPSVPLQEHLIPWKGRDIWLDLGCFREILHLSEDGCSSAPFPPSDAPESGFADRELHCHYCINASETTAQFTLWRTMEDVQQLLEEAAALGVTTTAGLYQELHSFFT